MDCFTIEEGTSRIRAFHAVPNGPAVDVYLNNNLAFTDVTYATFTDYASLPADSYTVTIYTTGSKTDLILSAIIDVPDGGIFTAVVSGDLTNLKLLVLDDDTENGVMLDYTYIRAVHLSPNAPAVTILANGTPLATNLAFRDMTEYVSVPSDTYDIDVTTVDGNTTVLSFSVVLMAETISTLYIIGDLSDLKPIYSIDGGTYLCQ